jgi:hypothetical protein
MEWRNQTFARKKDLSNERKKDYLDSSLDWSTLLTDTSWGEMRDRGIPRNGLPTQSLFPGSFQDSGEREKLHRTFGAT